MKDDIKNIQSNRTVNALIVDDSPYNLFVLEEMLQTYKKVKRIDQALNGEDAIKKILERKEEGKLYDLILLDMNMPIMDGVETIKELKKLEE